MFKSLIKWLYIIQMYLTLRIIQWGLAAWSAEFISTDVDMIPSAIVPWNKTQISVSHDLLSVSVFVNGQTKGPINSLFAKSIACGFVVYGLSLAACHVMYQIAPCLSVCLFVCNSKNPLFYLF